MVELVARNNVKADRRVFVSATDENGNRCLLHAILPDPWKDFSRLSTGALNEAGKDGRRFFCVRCVEVQKLALPRGEDPIRTRIKLECARREEDGDSRPTYSYLEYFFVKASVEQILEAYKMAKLGCLPAVKKEPIYLVPFRKVLCAIKSHMGSPKKGVTF